MPNTRSLATAPLGTTGDIRLVQLPHPGREHSMSASKRPWKRGDESHRRTFLQSPGTYRVSADGDDQDGELVFWGEWEGAAQRVTELSPVAGGPRWLCRPDPSGMPPSSDDGTPPQNTDQFVWGDAIRYTFCKQPGNQKLRRLGRGSLILFGSILDHQFVLDTVLVVAGWLEHEKPGDLAGVADPAYMRATIEPMYGWGDSRRTYRLYFGATPAEPVNGMFSFVPARRAAGAGSGFERPAIQLDGLLNPDAPMPARVLDVGADRLPEHWQTVVDSVSANRLVLATHLRLGAFAAS